MFNIKIHDWIIRLENTFSFLLINYKCDCMLKWKIDHYAKYKSIVEQIQSQKYQMQLLR